VYVLGNKPTVSDYYNDRPNTLYVIDGITDKIVSTRSFDADLNDIEINEDSGYAYISANAPSSGSGKAGVIFVVDGSSNRLIKDIILGENPGSMVLDPNKNKIYVLDSSLGSIFLIDGVTNHPVSTRSAIQFETNPHNSGDIFCNNARVNDLIVDYGYSNKVDCQAKAYPKFKFASWSGAVQGTMGNTSFEVSSDSKIVANFEELPSPLTITEWTIIITGALIAVPAVFFIKDRIKKRSLVVKRRK
jgi:DNA-binding beta-propeller fold protein YncE